MKETTAMQIEAMKSQSFGIEIEGNNITREKAAKVAAEFFGTGRYEYTARPQRLRKLECLGCRGA